MRLIGRKILCKKIVEEKVSEGGLILPNNYESENDFTVVGIGNRVKFVKVGDRVRKFKNVSGVPVVFRGDSLVILNEETELEVVL